MWSKGILFKINYTIKGNSFQPRNIAELARMTVCLLESFFLNSRLIVYFGMGMYNAP